MQQSEVTDKILTTRDFGAFSNVLSDSLSLADSASVVVSSIQREQRIAQEAMLT
jgi:hypothetical protein